MNYALLTPDHLVDMFLAIIRRGYQIQGFEVREASGSTTATCAGHFLVEIRSHPSSTRACYAAKPWSIDWKGKGEIKARPCTLWRFFCRIYLNREALFS